MLQNSNLELEEMIRQNANPSSSRRTHHRQSIAEKQRELETDFKELEKLNEKLEKELKALKSKKKG